MNAKREVGGTEILVAEDSRTQAEQLQTLLESNGYVVRVAPDGEKALQLALQHKPALVISDVLMPKLDGYGLCKAIKSETALKDVPVVLVTTLSDAQDVVKGLECGADNFIRKPFEERYLLSRIDYLLMNLELRKNQKMQLGLEIHLGGSRHFITAERQQILDLLISTYEQAVQINNTLLLREKELAHTNLHLEQLVAERTAALTAEVAERRRAEQRVARLNRVYAVLSGINTMIVRLRERQPLFQEVCRIAVDEGRLPFAWFGTFDAESGRITPVAKAGRDDGYLALVERFVVGENGSCALLTQALSLAEIVISNDIAADRRIGAEWRAAALERGFRSAALLPVTEDGCPVGLCTFFASEPEAFDQDEHRLLSEIASDISFALEFIGKTERLQYLSYHDAVTGLPNRALFDIQIEWAMAEATRHTRLVAVAFLDLDRFKIINDSLGHGAGDQLLIGVAERLRRTVCEGDTVVRLSADEFAVILTDLPHPNAAARVAQNILDTFAPPFQVSGHELFVSASLGLSLSAPDGSDTEDLLRNAEIAMSRAKQAGGNGYQFHLAEMTSQAHRRLALEGALRQALDHEEFLLHYQPVVNLEDNRMVGVEALVRWRHPEHGLVSPAEFIPLAEETGLILRLGEWVLRTACLDARTHLNGKLGPLRLAVNVSPRQFEKPDFARMVASTLEQTGMNPALLDLEITESLLMQNAQIALAAMNELGSLGARFSIDDFGTGYSSLAYLKSLPIGSLKIDRAFVRDLPGNASDAALVRAMISMARDLGMRVVAEGVETREQCEFLRANGCGYGQGYYFSRPVPVEEVAALAAGTVPPPR